MFTGIVEGTGRLVRIDARGRGRRVTFRAPFSLAGIRAGDSIAINGCCLTVTKKRGRLFETDLSHETLRVTNLGNLKSGDPVNLERPMRLGARVGGHLVQGHVDGIGTVESIHRNGSCLEIRIGIPRPLRRYLISKGSVAVDGISMTVNRLTRGAFTLVVIPHTLKKTNLALRKRGDRVNLEVDMVAKYIEQLKGS